MIEPHTLQGGAPEAYRARASTARVSRTRNSPVLRVMFIIRRARSVSEAAGGSVGRRVRRAQDLVHPPQVECPLEQADRRVERVDHLLIPLELAKGLGDRWTLELLLTHALWIGAGRSEEMDSGIIPFPSLYYTQALSDRPIFAYHAGMDAAARSSSERASRRLPSAAASTR